MTWQILAMWAVTMLTMIWFIRNERRLIANATMAQAALFYAQPNRHQVDLDDDSPSAPVRLALPRRHGLNRVERDFLKSLSEPAEYRAGRPQDRVISIRQL